MDLAKQRSVRDLAHYYMNQHLDVSLWTFDFDYAKRRFGLCNYSESKITLSRYLVEHHNMDEIEQVLLHEIAHAICGKRAGHGKRWLATAKKLGYRNEKMSGDEIAEVTANYLGICPNGHEHYRFRKPKRRLSCAKCSRSYDDRFLIRWSSRSK